MSKRQGVNKTAAVAFLGALPGRNASYLVGVDPVRLLRVLTFEYDIYDHFLRRNGALRKKSLATHSIAALAETPEIVQSLQKAPSLSDIPDMIPKLNDFLTDLQNEVNDNSTLPVIAASASLAVRPTTAKTITSNNQPETIDGVFATTLLQLIASLELQRCWRGKRARIAFHHVQSFRYNWSVRRSIATAASDGSRRDDPDAKLLQYEIKEKLMVRYKQFLMKTPKSSIEFLDFCAMVVQSAWRMRRVRRHYLRIIADLREMEMGKQVRKETRVSAATENDALKRREDNAAKRIQKLWQRFICQRTFAYLREMIRVRQKADPRKLLAIMNPREAAMIDPVMHVYLRFRLGGTSFPPQLFYKVYLSNQPLIDMNAFSPRDYTLPSNKRPLAADNNLKPDIPGVHSVKNEHNGWYARQDNNIWRPVFDAPIDPFLIGALQRNSKEKGTPYHNQPLIRRQAVQQKRLARKRQWLKQLYTMGRELELLEDELVLQDGFENDLDNEQLDGVHELIAWTRQLDFDSYSLDWIKQATSSSSDQVQAKRIEVQFNEVHPVEMYQLGRTSATPAPPPVNPVTVTINAGNENYMLPSLVVPMLDDALDTNTVKFSQLDNLMPSVSLL